MAVNQRELRRLLDPIRRKLRLIFSRSIVVVVRDDEGLQILQVKGLPGEVLDGIERFQNYGFTSVPLVGAEAILGFIGGARSHGVGVAVDDRRHRKKGMAFGEVAVHTDEGDSIHFKRGKIIAVTSGTEVDVNAPTIKLTGPTKIKLDGGAVELYGTGAVTIDGLTVTITGSSTVEIVGTTTIEGKVFLDHKHTDVQSGSSDTGGVA